MINIFYIIVNTIFVILSLFFLLFFPGLTFISGPIIVGGPSNGRFSFWNAVQQFILYFFMFCNVLSGHVDGHKLDHLLHIDRVVPVICHDNLHDLLARSYSVDLNVEARHITGPNYSGDGIGCTLELGTQECTTVLQCAAGAAAPAPAMRLRT